MPTVIKPYLGSSSNRTVNLSLSAPAKIGVSVVILFALLGSIFCICRKIRQRKSAITYANGPAQYPANQNTMNAVASNIHVSPVGMPTVYVIPTDKNQPLPGYTGNQTVPLQYSPYSHIIPGSTNHPTNSTMYSDQYSENQGGKLPSY